MIAIRRYEITMGDNPGCSKGVPITLDWGYVQQPPVLLNDYLDMKGGDAKPKKPRHFHLNSFKRYALLVRAGHDQEELRRVKKKIKLVKRGRRVSTWLYPAELIRHKVKKAFR